jgi:hypothetical protein
MKDVASSLPRTSSPQEVCKLPLATRPEYTNFQSSRNFELETIICMGLFRFFPLFALWPPLLFLVRFLVFSSFLLFAWWLMLLFL